MVKTIFLAGASGASGASGVVGRRLAPLLVAGTCLALTRSGHGAYNIAADDSTVVIDKAKRELGWTLKSRSRIEQFIGSAPAGDAS